MSSKNKGNDYAFKEISERAKVILLISLSAFISVLFIPLGVISHSFSNHQNWFLPFLSCLATYFLIIWYLKVRVLSKKKAGIANFIGIFLACGLGFLVCSALLALMLYKALAAGDWSLIFSRSHGARHSGIFMVLVGLFSSGAFTYAAYKRMLLTSRPSRPAKAGG